MISRSQHVFDRLPHSLAVLFSITYLIICGFYSVPETKIAGLNSAISLSVIRDRAERQILEISPVGRTPNLRKKVKPLSPPVSASVQAGQPALGDADAQSIRNVLVPKLFSFPVVQQPKNNPYYVSSSNKLITEFGLVRDYNNIGLLAHNNLAGKYFKYLEVGQDFYIIYNDGHADRYIVSAIHRFQALDSTSTGSSFIDLDSRRTLTSTELFTQMYTGAPHLTFQTCIYALGDASWGRLFVIAMPVAEVE